MERGDVNDSRILSFLAVCEESSFTKAAARLSLTQPAVSQHIRSLEEQFGGALFTYDHRILSLTLRGERLRTFALQAKADWDKAVSEIQAAREVKRLSFGATLTVGDFVMARILPYFLAEPESPRTRMYVDNTEVLLRRLRDGEIDFALIEGPFHREAYETFVFLPARFVAIGAPSEFPRGKPVPWEELFSRHLLVREPGSGTRSVLEQILAERGSTIEAFEQRSEIGSLLVIKNLVSRAIGISFLYEYAVEAECRDHTLAEIAIPSFDVSRNFYFAALPGSHRLEEYRRYCDRFLAIWDAIRDKE